MSYVHGEWYHGPITDAVLFEANSGSLGIAVTIDGTHGPVEGVLWLTDAAYPKTISKFEKWGLKPDDWMDPSFSVTPATWLAGKPTSFTADIQQIEDKETGERRTIVKAGVIGAGGGRKQADPAAISKAQALFQRREKGKAEAAGGFDAAPWPADDETPF